jgi:hypothetical protein
LSVWKQFCVDFFILSSDYEEFYHVEYNLSVTVAGKESWRVGEESWARDKKSNNTRQFKFLHWIRIKLQHIHKINSILHFLAVNTKFIVWKIPFPSFP